MTVLTMPARPGQDAGAGAGPVPWRGMLWVTWRQHRVVLVSVLITFVVAIGAMMFAGLQIHHDYAALLACRPAASEACQNLSQYFSSTDWHLAQYFHVAVLVAPVLLALFAGPPVLARELEDGTFRYAWTQGIGRVRWTVGKLAILCSAATIAALLITPLFTWLFAPFLTTQQVPATAQGVFAVQGVAYAAWTLLGVCLGAFVGALVRRVVAAMAVTLVSYAALVGATVFYLRSHLYPVTTFWPMQFFEGGWLLLLSVLLFAGTVWLVRRHAV